MPSAGKCVWLGVKHEILRSTENKMHKAQMRSELPDQIQEREKGMFGVDFDISCTNHGFYA